MRVFDAVQKDLGEGFEVRRVFPQIGLKSVGPFVFLDHMGPVTFEAGAGVDVRPHPHIGLSTLTYLYDGSLMHADSLGTRQMIRPGEVNLMTAGRGIVHSERTDQEVRKAPHGLEGLQLWIALPTDQEERAPNFEHVGRDALPRWEEGPVQFTLVAGGLHGKRSEVTTHTTTLFVDFRTDEGGEVTLRGVRDVEVGLYVSSGRCELEGTGVSQGQMAVCGKADSMRLRMDAGSRAALLGGASVGDRTVWWNLVSSRPELIERAKDDWKHGRFDMVKGDEEFIPLPED